MKGYNVNLNVPTTSGKKTTTRIKSHAFRRFFTALAVGFVTLALGCAGIQDKEQRCQHYSSLYDVYLASTSVREPSNDEILAAVAAAAFLRSYCGWEATNTSPPGTRSAGPAIDQHGVPILIPPN